MPEMGFKSGQEKRKIKKPSKNEIIYSHTFKDLILGDVAVSIEPVLQEMGLDFEEISTFKDTGMMGRGETVEVPFIRHQAGDIEIPFGTYRVEGIGDIGMSIDGSNMPYMKLHAILVDKSNKPRWNEFLKLVAGRATKTSIFKGRAVKVTEPEDLLVPHTLPLDSEVQLIFNPPVEDEIATTVFWPLLNREKAHQVGVRTRRGAIFEGHYGSGKSILLYKAAQAANRAGWGILHVTSNMVRAALVLAPMLEPVCIIVEDMDASAHGDRDRLNGLLNSISSVATKTSGDYMLLLSTNFLERIDPALLRPERIDAIIKVELPTEDTIRRLIKLFSNGSLDESESLDTIAKALEGSTPAIISEVCQRSLIDAHRLGDGKITESSLVFHATRMDRQRKLAVPEFRKDTQGDMLADTLHHVTQYGRD